MKRRERLVIALDGPAGAGKSTAGKKVSERLGYSYIDTGSMYRVVGLMAAERGVAVDDDEALEELLASLRISFAPGAAGQRIAANGRDVTAEIRSPAIGQWASRVSARPVVRQRLVAMQRELGERGGVVMDGRDIGTVVFPSADVKVYLDAALPERAKRRCLELQEAGETISYDEILRDMEERDRRDCTRTAAPLKAAADAVIIDTTSLGPEDVCERILSLVRDRVRS